MAFFFNCSVWMLLITWIIKQWFPEWHLLFTVEQHLCIFMNKKLTLNRRISAERQHISALFYQLCTNDHIPVNTSTTDICWNIVGFSLSALCCNLMAATLLNNHFYLTQGLRHYDFVQRSQFDCICSASTCFIFHTYLFHYSFTKSFTRQKTLQVFHNHLFSPIPDEASSRSTRWTIITRQSLAWVVTKFNYETEFWAFTIS